MLLTENKPRYIKIFGDSQAALKALACSTCKANTVKAAHDSLKKLAVTNQDVCLQWINIGLDGNELADKYAKLRMTATLEHVRTNTTINQIKSGVKNYLYHKWREKWTALKKCRQTKLFYPQPDRSKFKQVKYFTRMGLKLYIQAITGQNNLSYLKKSVEDETLSHIVE